LKLLTFFIATALCPSGCPSSVACNRAARRSFHHGHKRNLLHVKSSDAAPTTSGNGSTCHCQRAVVGGRRKQARCLRHRFPYGFREDPPPSMDRPPPLRFLLSGSGRYFV
jgi:hypothetical protein